MEKALNVTATLFQGIEALEYYIDPSAEAQVEEKKPEDPGAGTATGSTPGVAPTVSPGQPPGQPVAPVSPDQPAVFCQKGDYSPPSFVLHILPFTGKCYPYDPSKVKGVNLEAKPGMIIQAAPTTASPKRANPTMSPQRGPSPPQKGHKGQIPPGQKGQRREDDERGKSKSPSSPKAGKTSVQKCDYSRQAVGSRFSSGTQS